MNLKRNFVFAFLLTEGLYLAFYLLKSWGVNAGVDALRLNNNTYMAVSVFLITPIIFIYRTAYRYITGEISFKVVFILSLIINLSLIFLNNMASDDLSTYIYRARIIAHYGANPYVVKYNDFPGDAFVAIKTIWSARRAVYGPLIMWASGILARLAGDSLFLNFFVFKLFFTGLNIVSGFLVYRITKSKKAFYLYAYNPLIIFEIAINGHLDIAVIFTVVLAVYFLISHKNWFSYGLSIVFLTASFLVKYLTGIFGFIFFVFAIKHLKKTKLKIKFITAAVVGSLVLTYLSLAPFWVGIRTFDRLFSLAQAELYGASPVVWVLNIFMKYKNALSLGRISFILLFIFYGFRILRWKNLDIGRLLRICIILFFALLLTSLPLVEPWYFVTPIALMCLSIAFDRRMKPNYIFFATMLGFAWYFLLR